MSKSIVIIPARGGSKRLKHKNIYPLLGKPLLAYSIEACQKSEYISGIYVSSDDDDILKVAIEYGATPLKRSSELADDHTPKIIAIREAIEQLNGRDIRFDNVAIVQANSPQLTATMLNKGFKLFLDKNLWEVMSADSDGVQNAAFRIIKQEVAFQNFLSAHCGFVTCDVMDVHTIEDIRELEKTIK